MAHRWRKPVCAIAIGALRKNQWRIGCAFGFLLMARQWRSGAPPAEKSYPAMSGPRSRDKGARIEGAIVRLLQGQGIGATKISGMYKPGPGSLSPPSPVGTFSSRRARGFIDSIAAEKRRQRAKLSEARGSLDDFEVPRRL